MLKAIIERHSKTFGTRPLFFAIDKTEWAFGKFWLFTRLRVAYKIHGLEVGTTLSIFKFTSFNELLMTRMSKKSSLNKKISSKHCFRFWREFLLDTNCIPNSQISHTYSSSNASHCNSFGVVCSVIERRCQKIKFLMMTEMRLECNSTENVWLQGFVNTDWT